MSPTQSCGFLSEAGGYTASVEQRLVESIPVNRIGAWISELSDDISMQQQAHDVDTPMSEVSRDEGDETGEELEPWETPDDRRKIVEARVQASMPEGRPKWTWNEEVRQHALTLEVPPDAPPGALPTEDSPPVSDAQVGRALSEIPADELLVTMNDLKVLATRAHEALEAQRWTYRPQLRQNLAGENPGLLE